MTDLPHGYRWATAQEAEAHSVEPNRDMIVVPRTADATGKPYTQGEADLALPVVPLPRDEDGHIITSASYGELFAVEITYNTDPDGKWVEDDDYSNRTLHGPLTEAEAEEWMDAYPDGDRDLKDMRVVTMNAVRPARRPE